MKDLNYNHLFYFYVIAKEGSIVKAAKALHLTQPTLSAQLRTLEEQIEEKLFNRVGRKLILSESGKLVFDYAARMFRLGEELGSAIEQEGLRARRELRVGIAGAVSRTLVFEHLMPVIGNRSNYVSIEASTNLTLADRVATGEIDFALSSEPLVSRKRSLWTQRFNSTPVMILAHKKYKLRAKQFPKSLHEFPFINFPERNRLSGEIHLFFRKQKISPYFLAEMEELTLLRRAAETGLAAVALPENLANALVNRAGSTVVVLGELKGIRSHLWMTIRESMREDGLMQTILREFKNSRHLASQDFI